MKTTSDQKLKLRAIKLAILSGKTTPEAIVKTAETIFRYLKTKPLSQPYPTPDDGPY